MIPRNPFQVVVESFDLDLAVRSASRPNDLLPPRPEDKVAGRIGNRFSEALRHELEQGIYDPTPAHFVSVPKTGSTTSRPAALLSLRDRVVYQAIVDQLSPKIETALADDGVLFGPRATGPTRSWAEFEAAPLDVRTDYIALIDVAAYYETVPHELLTQAVVATTGRRELTHALSTFLERVMGGSRGLPQGVLASDALASLYLTPVDQAMRRKGYRYFRRGDDMRVAVDTYADGLAIISEVETVLRRLGLILNAAKTRVLKTSTYTRQLATVEEARQEVRDRLGAERVERLYEMSKEELEELALSELEGEAELEEMLFEVYHGEASPQDIIEQLEDRVEPSDVEVAYQLFREALAAAPGTNGGTELSREDFHGRVATSLTILTAARADQALTELGPLIGGFPDETQAVVSYLSALLPARPAEVVRVLEGFLLERANRPPWEDALLLSVIVDAAAQASPALVEFLLQRVADDSTEWLVRILCSRILARLGLLDRERLNQLWELAPPAFRTDLVAAGADLTQHVGWASEFLEGCRGDVILEVVEGDVGRDVETRRLVAAAVAAVNTEAYAAISGGDRVFHARWRFGVVESVSEGGGRPATVIFGEKRRLLILAYAPLIKVDTPGDTVDGTESEGGDPLVEPPGVV